MSQVSLEVNTYSREDILPKNTAEQPAKSYDELYKQGMEAELHQLDAGFSFKVKNELVAQIFNSLKQDLGLGKGTLQINIASVADILRAEIRTEKDRHFQSAVALENEVIPLAGTRTDINFEIPHYYTVRDLDNLQARSDIHTEVSLRLAAVEATGEQGLFDISETYIQRMQMEARDEALAIVTRQKKELEEKNRLNELKIDELQDVIGILGIQLEMAHEQADIRTAPVPDQETTLQLVKDATRLAA